MRTVVEVLIVLSALMSAATWASGPRLQGIGGYWYDAEQDGFGMTITVPRPGTAVITWTTFDLEGRSLTLYSEARIEGRRIAGDVLVPSGVRFGEFDQGPQIIDRWGALSIEFLDCRNAEMQWTADLPGYVDGQVTLERLAYVTGLGCEDVGDFPVGLYSGTVSQSGLPEGFPTDYPALGYMDSTGRLWGLTNIGSSWTDAYESDWMVLAPPGWINPAPVASVLGAPETGDLDQRVLSGLANAASFFVDGEPARDVGGLWTLQGFAEAQVDDPAPDSAVGQEWISSPLPGYELVNLRSIESISGDLFVPTFSQRIFAGIDYARLRVEPEGSLCLALEESVPPEGECLYTGEISMSSTGDPGLLDFQLEPTDTMNAPAAFSGRAWYVESDRGGRLFLVGLGSDPFRVFGLTAQRSELIVR